MEKLLVADSKAALPNINHNYMTSTEISLIQNSWKFLRGVEPEIIGDVFYSKLFFDAPYLKPLFKSPVSEQSVKLINMLNVVVGRLEHLDGLKNDIKTLGIRHSKYGVKSSHYDLAGNALVWTLKTALGSDWTDSLANAWIKCYTTLASAMIEAAETVQQGN